MSNQPFQVSQALRIQIPKDTPAYPVPCNEWSLIKNKITDLSFSNDYFNDGGWAALGAGISVFASTFSGGIFSEIIQDTIWVIAVSLVIIGILCLVFANQQKKQKKAQASEILAQMEIIESRYPSE